MNMTPARPGPQRAPTGLSVVRARVCVYRWELKSERKVWREILLYFRFSLYCTSRRTEYRSVICTFVWNTEHRVHHSLEANRSTTLLPGCIEHQRLPYKYLLEFSSSSMLKLNRRIATKTVWIILSENSIHNAGRINIARWVTKFH